MYVCMYYINRSAANNLIDVQYLYPILLAIQCYSLFNIIHSKY